MVRLTIDTVSIYTHCSTHLPSLRLPREEGCLCRQLAARWENIWPSSESGQRRQKHQVSAKPKIRFQVKLMLYAIQQNHHEETPTPSVLAFLPSLNDYPAVHWEKPKQPGAQWRNWGRVTRSCQAGRLQCGRCPTSPWRSLELSELSTSPWKNCHKSKLMAEKWQQHRTISVVDES